MHPHAESACEAGQEVNNRRVLLGSAVKVVSEHERQNDIFP